jgi:hypothetical protein
MEKRQPFKVDRLVQIYDFLQIILSLVIFVEVSYVLLSNI